MGTSTRMSNLFVARNDAGDDQPHGAKANALPPDAAERELALDVTRSWIVEAPAGSGKTGLLIQRYLKLLAEESVTQPGQVLAITFTKKAAAEIRERVVAQLESAQRGDAAKDSSFERETRTLAEAVLEKDKRLEWGLLASPQRMSLKTIDAVCAQVGQMLPVLSGAGGGTTTPRGWELHREAARRTLLQLGGDDTELSAALETLILHRDGNLSNCEALLAEMLGWREQWGELVPLTRDDLDDAYLEGVVLPKIERALELAVCKGLSRATREMPAELLTELATLGQAMGEGAELESPLAICRELHRAPGDAAEDLSHWRAMAHLLLTQDGGWRAERGVRRDFLKLVELQKQHSAQLKSILAQLRENERARAALEGIRSLPPARYPADQWIITKALFRVLSRALVELQLIFAERGERDFTEVGLLAKYALQQDGALGDLSSAQGAELRHLLVDEMQDTSSSHYQLIQLLTQSWDGRSQTVFLVGDPKQSIYLFRQARVERFIRTMYEERLGNIPVHCLRLTANFRSQAGLVTAFNQDFSQIFPATLNAAQPEEVPYVKASAVRGSSAARGEVWHAAAIPYSADAGARTQARQERTQAMAAEIRHTVDEWRRRPLPPERKEPWRIAVLVRARPHLMEIVAAFHTPDEHGQTVPIHAVEIDPLRERQEILDLVSLTRALLHPADKVAWLAILRAPWCGVTLADLHQLAGGDDPAWAKRNIPQAIVARTGLLSPDGAARVERLWSVMQAAESRRGRLPVSPWVERTWRSLGADVTMQDDAMDNAQQYFRLLDEAEEPGGRINLPKLEAWLGQLYARPSVHPGAVDLMTIHKSKGLEWDLVMVPSLERTGKNSHGRLLTWMEIDDATGDATDEQEGQAVAHGILAPISRKGSASKELNDWMKHIEDARHAAERKRLLYVACTRAREELHLFASPQEKKKGGVSVRGNTLLEAAWPAAGRHFAVPSPVDGTAKILPFGIPAKPEEGLSLAAAAGATPERPAMVERLPAGFDPTARFRAIRPLLPAQAEQHGGPAYFERPEGSLAARSFGNAVHGFLELLSKRLKAGASVDELTAEMADWSPRMEAVLRGDGLPPAAVKREAQRVLASVQTALADDVGQWVLGAREAAASEYGFTTWGERRRSFRLDRMFVAGTEPLATGSECLWIVDYKTGSHGRGVGIEAFLEAERKKYGAQMESYAAAMQAAAQGKELRVGLYYPMLPKLLWWRPGTD